MAVRAASRAATPGPASARPIERQRELAAIDGALARVTRGEGSLVAIRGPAGIGKSVLLAHAAIRAAPGTRVLRATGDELESGLPFGVADQLLGDLVGSADAEAPGEAGILRTVHLVHRRIESLARDAPLALVVDDAHWSDPESLRALLYVARRLEGLASTVLVAHRTAGQADAERADLLYRLAAAADAVLEPAALSEAGVAGLVRGRLPESPPRLAAACARESAGNPLLLRWLLDRVVEESAESGEPPEPESVGRLAEGHGDDLLARLRNLGPEHESIARATAILATDASLERVALATETDRADLAERIGRLQRAAILAEGEPLRFVHPLVKSAVLDAMTHGERSGLALATARALSRTGASAERVASRLIEAGGCGEDWALDALDGAALAASRAGAPRTELRYLSLAVAGEGTPRRDLLEMRLARAQAAIGAPGFERRFEQALERIGSPVAKARALSELAGIRGTRYELREAADLLLRGIDLLGPAEPQLQTQLLAQIGVVATMGGTPPRRARDLLAGGVGALLAERPAEPSEAERMLLAQAGAQMALTMSVDRAGCERVLRPLIDPGAPAVHQAALAPLLIAVVLCDELETAEGLLDAAIADAGDRGAINEHLQMLGGRAYVKLRAGDPSGALQDVGDGIAQAEEVGASVPIHSIAGALAALAAEGPAAATSYLPDEEPDHWRGTLLEGEMKLARGRVAAARGEPARALELLSAGGATLVGKGVLNPGYHEWRGTAAVAALACGERERADGLAEEALDRARAFGSPRAIGIALRAAGLVRGGDGGLDLLRDSVAALEDSPATLARATSLLELGAALRRAHRPKDARDRLQEAVDLAHACRAAPLVERGLSELRTLGLRRRRPAATGLEALSPAELRTARLAAGGRSNKEIAQSHFLALRTVESHLTSCYRKLGIDSRERLPEVLGGAGPGSTGVAARPPGPA